MPEINPTAFLAAGSAGQAQAVPRRVGLSPALTAWLVLLSALAVLILSVMSVITLARLGAKIPPYRTVQPIGLTEGELVGEVAQRLQEVEPMRAPQLTKLKWFLEQCGTTVVRGTVQGEGEQLKSADELVILGCGLDPERNTQWYKLTSGVVEVGPTGPAFYPEYGKWSLQYGEREVAERLSIRIRKESLLVTRYGDLPTGITFYTEQPGPGGAMLMDKNVAPWRVSLPVLTALIMTILPGLAIGLVGIGAWRDGRVYPAGAIMIGAWAVALLATWVTAVFNVRAVETFVDILQNSRPGLTRLPWIGGYAAAAVCFALAYWAHLRASSTRELPSQRAA